MDKASHLSVVIDLSPIQWHLSAEIDNMYPLSLKDFLSQLLAFLNMHVASKHENMLAVFGAFPEKRFANVIQLCRSMHLQVLAMIRLSVMLYSSTDPPEVDGQATDANSYPPFRVMDYNVMQHILDEMDALGEPMEEGRSYENYLCGVAKLKYPQAPCALVGAVTKALCCEWFLKPLNFRDLMHQPDINRISHLSNSSNPSDDPAVLPDPRILILSVSPDLSTSYIPIMNSIFSAQKLVCLPLFSTS